MFSSRHLMGDMNHHTISSDDDDTANILHEYGLQDYHLNENPSLTKIITL